MHGKKVVAALILAVAISAGIVFAGGTPNEDSFAKLMSGNKRYVSGALAQKDIGDTRRKELAGGQNPAAVIVTCSDSRVAPEYIFDQGLGDIFIVRVAGNVMDKVGLGSIEYAVEHLHTPLIVLMGHEKCGAVTAAVDATGKPEGNIGAIVAKILPAVKKARAMGGSKDELVNNAIKQNVFQSYHDMLASSPVIREMIEKGEVKVVEALYHIASGEVEVLQAPAAETHHGEHHKTAGK